MNVFKEYGEINIENGQKRTAYYMEGVNEIASNKCCCIILAGGQGTRLGFNKPKGMFVIDKDDGKSLYEIFCQKIFTIQSEIFWKFGIKCQIMLYIMTNDLTYTETVDFFHKNDYFSLEREQVRIFKQNMIECMGKEGELIYVRGSCGSCNSCGSCDSNDGSEGNREINDLKIAMAPNGNGGIYRALVSEGILDDILKKSISYISVVSIDNFLISVVDPIVVGIHKCENSDFITKTVSREQSDEKMGMLYVDSDGKARVKEYTEMISSNLEMDMKLEMEKYDNFVIGAHSFTVDFIKRICSGIYKELPYHLAHKKIMAVIEDDSDKDEYELIEKEVDCIKRELFIFDVIPYAENVYAYQVEMITNYMPLKNKEGKYGIEHVRNVYKQMDMI